MKVPKLLGLSPAVFQHVPQKDGEAGNGLGLPNGSQCPKRHLEHVNLTRFVTFLLLHSSFTMPLVI